MSCTTTAKICGCNVKTVAKYRDQEGWITKQQVKELCRGGGQTTLTPNIAAKLASGWRLHIEDVNLCPIVGITHGQLVRWFRDNREVTIVRTVCRLGPNGKPIEGKDGLTRRMETVGLRQLRAREWANFEYSYMQKLDMDAERAEQQGDLNTAFKIRTWVLSKRLPKKFGNNGVDVSVNTQANVVSIDEMNLPLETRKQILAKIREKRHTDPDNGLVSGQ